jgi:predicted unusual protein kinase regulating ubiquinone biosynthesis (AarF/ABC1/UbiB family)
MLEMKKAFDNLYFIFSVFGIFMKEYLLFVFNFTNYSEFIKNVAFALSKKNILFVKLFQAIALNNNLIDNNANNILIKFTDSVPYTQSDIDSDVLHEIKEKYDLEIDIDCPINAGMISLVYKAKKGDVFQIIKIKRKGIDETLNSAIEKFNFINWLWSFLPLYKKMNICKVVENTLDSMTQQLNFAEEVKNTIEMREKCKNMEYVKIPEINSEITTLYPNVIMMEFIDGNHISKIDPEDYEIYARQVLKYGFVSAFTGGSTHADMHAGNILFLKDENGYKIALIDFGLVTRIDSESLKETAIELASEVFTNDSSACGEKMLSIFLSPPDLKTLIPPYFYDEIHGIINDILNETLHSKKDVDQFRIFEFFTRLNTFLSNNELREYNIEPNKEFMKLQAAIAMANGISITLCKNNYVRVLNEVLDEVFHVGIFMDG